MVQQTLKIGGNAFHYDFDLNQFYQKYISQNHGRTYPEHIIEDFFQGNTVRNPMQVVFETAPVNHVFFQEGTPVYKIKKGLFGQKQVADPSHNFLLLEDETLEELTATDAYSTKLAGFFPFAKFLLGGQTCSGKAYTTKRRLILDAAYTEFGYFPSMHIWGTIDLRNVAAAFGRPAGFNIPYLGEQNIRQEINNVVLIRPEICISKMSTMSGEKYDCTIVTQILDNLNETAKGSGQFFDVGLFFVSREGLDHELKKLKTTDLQDLLALWDCAATYNLQQATTDKKTATLKV